MPYRSTDHLLKLILRLTPSEKRQLRIQVNKTNVKGNLLFMSLFDHLDKEKEYDEELIIQKIPGIKRNQLSNLKSSLYRQILQSLRTTRRSSEVDIGIYENIDYATILLSKGMYNASLSILDKTKKTALEHNNYTAVLAILEKEKHIESIYVTGSMYPKATELRNETKNILKLTSLQHSLSSLSLSLYGLYLQYGHVKDQRDFDFITDFFKNNLPEVEVNKLDFYGKLYYYQSYVWYHHMTQDFANTYRYAQKWVDLFDEQPEWKDKESTLYIKGLHNILNPLFLAQRYDKFLVAYEKLVAFGNERLRLMDRNEESMFKLMEVTHGINRYFLTADFASGVEYVKQVEQFIENNTYDWDLNRIMLFNYKIACIYFCHGDLDHANLLLNKITNEVYPNFREDIQCFARLLNLIVHFDLGNESLVTHQVKSTFRFLSKMKHLQKALQEILSFLRRLPRIQESHLKNEFKKLRNKLLKIESQQFERRPFLYLDIIAWLDSKIEAIPVGDVMKRKAGIQ